MNLNGFAGDILYITMTKCIKYLIALIIICMIFGCGGAENRTYEGLPLKTWVERLESPEKETRLDALSVIKGIGKPAIAAEPYVRKLARYDPSPAVMLSAIETLETFKVTVVEFQEFLDDYYSPIIPAGEQDELDLFENETEEFDDDDILEHISGADDLAYLKELMEGSLDSGERADSNIMPRDSAGYADWMGRHRSEAIDNLLNQLNNPDMLALMLEFGEDIEREFAARQLSELDLENPKINEAIEKALEDPNDSVRVIAERALKKLDSEY
ncbi:hypothetical protein HQ587_00095 [bacterium]|nr:hypothetical protein [bacterium]